MDGTDESDHETLKPQLQGQNLLKLTDWHKDKLSTGNKKENIDSNPIAITFKVLILQVSFQVLTLLHKNIWNILDSLEGEEKISK